jgi:hypothetical protein
MIAELIVDMINLEDGHRNVTYRSVLFPQPAVRLAIHQCKQHASGYGSVRFP